MGRRTLAFVIDALIGTAIFIGVVAATFTTSEFASTTAAEDLCSQMEFFTDNACVNFGATVWVGEPGDVGIVFLLWGLFVLLNTLLIPGFTGWSIGKLIMGLRVVKQDTFELAGMGPNLGRGLLWIADSFPFFVPLAGFVLGLATPGHRRIGDMVAKTFVIDRTLVGRPTAVRGVGGAPAQPAVAMPFPPPPGMPIAPPATISAPPPSTPPPPPTGQLPVSSPPPFAAPTGSPVVASPTPEPPTPTTSAPTAPPPVSSTPPTFPPPPIEPEAVDQPPPPATPPPPPAPEPEPGPEQRRPGIDGPQWDEARDTYIQWDPELTEWMEWNEAGGRWVPISR
jgi:uncharacterized RDD family membrane protein YckC